MTVKHDGKYLVPVVFAHSMWKIIRVYELKVNKLVIEKISK